jgi:hypothetical protein
LNGTVIATTSAGKQSATYWSRNVKLFSYVDGGGNVPGVYSWRCTSNYDSGRRNKRPMIELTYEELRILMVALYYCLDDGTFKLDDTTNTLLTKLETYING